MEMDKAAVAASNRRSFLKTAGAASLGLAGAAVLAKDFVVQDKKVEAAAYSEIDILNFALNLEYLEAEFYLMSTFGTTLVKSGVITEADTTGPTMGGHMVPNFGKSPTATLAHGLRLDEVAHVKLLRGALGNLAVKKPAINLNALGYGFASVNSWLELARQFEDVGISAYLGAAPALAGNATYLSTAASIMATEGQHAGTVRWGCIMNGQKSPAVDSKDIPPSPSKPYSTTGTGLSVARTPSQVLNIVYHGGRCSGGFYPNGMNGGITCQG